LSLVGKADDPQARVMMEDRLEPWRVSGGPGKREWTMGGPGCVVDVGLPGTGRSVMKRTFPPDFLSLRGKKASQ